MRLPPWLLLLLLQAPLASAWTLDLAAPPAAGAGVPFLVEACVTGPPDALVRLRLDLAGPGERVRQQGEPVVPGRYGPLLALGSDGRACFEAEVAPPDEPGARRLDARVRPEGGRAGPGAQAGLTLLDVPVATVRTSGAPVALRDAQGNVLLRAPARDGIALVPLLPDAVALTVRDERRGLPPAPALRIARVDGAPFEGVTLANDGAADAPLAGWTLRQGAREMPLPDVAVPAGAALFLGARPPLDAAAARAPFEWDARAGTLELRAGSHVVHAVDVPRLAAGERWISEGVRRQGMTDESAAAFLIEGPITGYVTPDAGVAPVLALLEGAREEILLEGYTLTSPEVAHALARAVDRGVRVRVLLEGAPVGGIPPEQAQATALLDARGAQVRLLAGAPDFPARYRTLHAKALVVDREKVLVGTENFHASSYPAQPDGDGTRGFGLVVEDAGLARRLATVLDADAAPWPDVQPPDLASLPPPDVPPPMMVLEGPVLRLAPATRSAALVLSPDDPDALARRIREARASVDIVMLFAQPTFDEGRPNPMLDALVAAAREGAHVRLLLDGRHDEGGNAEVARRLGALAAREGLPLEARVHEGPRTLHAKLVLVDGAGVYVGSLNWGEASLRRNREVGLLVEEPALAAYFQVTFERDWRAAETQEPPPRETPAAPPLAGLAVVLLAAKALSARRPTQASRASRSRGSP